MIEHIPLLLVGMAWNKKQDQEPIEKWKPTSEDVRKLEKGMSAFSRKNIGGRWWYPFEQYCLSLGIISERNGDMQVRAPEAWRRLNDTYDYMKWQNQRDMESFFQANPEERVKYEQELEKIIQECREMVGKMKVPETNIEV